MVAKSLYTPEVYKKRHAEQVYRSRMLDRRIVEKVKRLYPGEYEQLRRRLVRDIAAERGPLPGSENG